MRNILNRISIRAGEKKDIFIEDLPDEYKDLSWNLELPEGIKFFIDPTDGRAAHISVSETFSPQVFDISWQTTKGEEQFNGELLVRVQSAAKENNSATILSENSEKLCILTTQSENISSNDEHGKKKIIKQNNVENSASKIKAKEVIAKNKSKTIKVSEEKDVPPLIGENYEIVSTDSDGKIIASAKIVRGYTCKIGKKSSKGKPDIDLKNKFLNSAKEAECSREQAEVFYKGNHIFFLNIGRNPSIKHKKQTEEFIRANTIWQPGENISLPGGINLELREVKSGS